MEENIPIEQKESVKLIKNTKGYNWEVKILGKGQNNELTNEELERLSNLDKELKAKFGSN